MTTCWSVRSPFTPAGSPTSVAAGVIRANLQLLLPFDRPRPLRRPLPTMGRGRMKKIKAMDPFSKTGGVYATDDRKFNAPPKKHKRKHRGSGGDDDDEPIRMGSLLMGRGRPGRPGGAPVSVPPAPSVGGGSRSGSAPAPAKRGRGSSAAPEGEEEGEAPRGRKASHTTAASGDILLSMLPGETFHAFTQRVAVATGEKLRSAAASKVKPMSAKRKEKLKEVREARKAKGADAVVRNAVKAIAAATGNAAALREAKIAGEVDDTTAEEVLKGADVVEFGERVEAPPLMEPKMLAYFDKLKKKSEAARAAGTTRGPQPSKAK